jgi:RHS repeat-associated protein
VIKETVAPGTEFEAARRYEYDLCANTGEQAEQRMFDVKQVKTLTRFDGLNRAISELREDPDNLPPGRQPRPTYAAIYDALGQLSAETEYDWIGTDPMALVTSYEYDGWGAQRCVTGPDGVKTFEETDPIGTAESQGPIQRSWREGAGSAPKVSGVTETWLNLFEKPTRIERFDLASKRVSLQLNLFDGLGRTQKETVGFDQVQRVTLYGYDVFDRLIENTLPDNAVVRRNFASHSREDLPTLISVNNIVLGEQVFDGLDRRTKAITGGREQLFDYEPGQTQPKTVTTPGGEVIEYRYLPQLGSEPVMRRLPRFAAEGLFDEATYEYDKDNARLLSCQEQGIQLKRDYFSTGEPKSETRTVEGTEYTMNYEYSRLGRLSGYIDVLGQKQTYRYDAKGRLEHTQLGTTTSTFTYDSLGRTATIRTSDSASVQSVGITLTYDEFDRETLREFDLNGVKQQLSQVYNDVDGLDQRTLEEGGVVLRDETYRYDPRGRLTRYDCTGTQPPVDPYNKAIISQAFTFSELDNMRIVLTTFAGGNNRATYTYDSVDPTQLRKVANTHADYPKEITLDYNLDGHLISDEEQRTLEYDALGRLISVSAAPGETPGSYSYDPLDKLAGMNDGSGQEQRFYQGDNLASQKKGSNSSTFMRGSDVVLAEHQAGADPKSLLLASDHKNTVVGEVSKTGRKDVAYSAYGHRAEDGAVKSLLGYNGERREGQTGWYLLGNGYRAFSPVLMRFCSPDSWSPFGEGGVNGYVYCVGDPINNVDPTGHFFSAIARLFRPHTNSSVASKIPEGLRTVPRGKSSAILHKVGHSDVAGAKLKYENTQGRYKVSRVNMAGEKESYDKNIKKSNLLLSEGRKADADVIYNRSVTSLNEARYEYSSAQRAFDTAKTEYDFLLNNVGNRVVTRPSSTRLKIYLIQKALAQRAQYIYRINTPMTSEQFEQKQKRKVDVREVREADIW